MNATIHIDDDPSAYGSKGQSWHHGFVAYMVAIVTHPTYEGMPDAVKDDGKIQWEAPSNRKSGKYQHTHRKRRDWWKSKARSIGVSLSSNTWISDTAKHIHPTGEKPCKRCGRVMRIAYTYPNGYLLRRIHKAFGVDFERDPLESILDLIQRLVDTYGPDILRQLPKLLMTGAIDVPDLGTELDEWLAWVEDIYIPSEPSLLSPGAMSNAPDRFDGFHSFNLCCRKKADTGRHDLNMRSYTTDRRVFEYWSEGDWIAADRMMGLVGAKFRDEPCADGGDGPCSADHIGPLSLGFTHRPEFRLLSIAANSAKNNRMTLSDVIHLREVEQTGVKVISWYAKTLWDIRKGDVVDEETALRLSKLLRDNQRNAMLILSQLLDEGYLLFLATLLELRYAERNVEFNNLSIENYITVFNGIVTTPRLTKYAQEQKARRVRIGFEALRSYSLKENRHFFEVPDIFITKAMQRALSELKAAPGEIKLLDTELASLLIKSSEGASEEALRDVSESIPSIADFDCFQKAHTAISKAMEVVGARLSDLWEDDRYVRAPFDFEGD